MPTGKLPETIVKELTVACDSGITRSIRMANPITNYAKAVTKLQGVGCIHILVPATGGKELFELTIVHKGKA